MAAAVYSFERIQETKTVSAELLRPIVDAASSSSRILLQQGTAWMTQLIAEFPEAQDALIGMSEASEVTPRMNAIICLASSTPRLLSLKILRKSINDKNPRVRQLAASWASKLNLREFVLELTARLSLESNLKTKRCIEMFLGLLRDRYFVEAKDETIQITLLTKAGHLTWHEVPVKEFNEKGAAIIIAEAIRKVPS